MTACVRKRQNISEIILKDNPKKEFYLEQTTERHTFAL